MSRKTEPLWRTICTLAGLFVIIITLAIGAFLAYQGVFTFTQFHHSLAEFFGFTTFAPIDSAKGGGKTGALIFIVGSLSTCMLALLIATPLCLGAAIFMNEISPKLGKKYFRPIIQILAGTPSVVYGWIGLTVLVPFLKETFQLQVGQGLLAAALVLALMIFPTITSVASDVLSSVTKEIKMASFGLGATRWQTIYRVIIPASLSGLISALVLGLARAMGEALAVAMVIGQTTALPSSIFSPTKTMTTEIASQMGNASEGGELKAALWTLALVLFLISLLSIFLIHRLQARRQVT